MHRLPLFFDINKSHTQVPLSKYSQRMCCISHTLTVNTHSNVFMNPRFSVGALCILVCAYTTHEAPGVGADEGSGHFLCVFIVVSQEVEHKMSW